MSTNSVIGEVIKAIIDCALMSVLASMPIYGQNYLPSIERYPRSYSLRRIRTYKAHYRTKQLIIMTYSRISLKALGWRIVNIA